MTAQECMSAYHSVALKGVQHNGSWEHGGKCLTFVLATSYYLARLQ